MSEPDCDYLINVRVIMSLLHHKRSLFLAYKGSLFLAEMSSDLLLCSGQFLPHDGSSVQHKIPKLKMILNLQDTIMIFYPNHMKESYLIRMQDIPYKMENSVLSKLTFSYARYSIYQWSRVSNEHQNIMLLPDMQ